MCSFALWVVTNIAFFCTIDLKYANTFFGMKTASQYTVELYKTAANDGQRFDAIFSNRIQYVASQARRAREASEP